MIDLQDSQVPAQKRSTLEKLANFFTTKLQVCCVKDPQANPDYMAKKLAGHCRKVMEDGLNGNEVSMRCIIRFSGRTPVVSMRNRDITPHTLSLKLQNISSGNEAIPSAQY